MESQTTLSSKTESVRKAYLNRRAQAIRESFAQNAPGFAQIASEIRTQEFNATKDELLFSDCLHWMQSHLHLNAHITKLAKEFDVSVRKIQRLFALFTDQTYTTILLEMRMEESKKYLTEHKRSIGEVAYLVGIKDHAYFTYLFRKHTGQTPSQFRIGLMNSTEL